MTLKCKTCGHEEEYHFPNKKKCHGWDGKGYCKDTFKCEKFVPFKDVCPYTGKEGYVKEEDCHCFCCGTHKPSCSNQSPYDLSRTRGNPDKGQLPMDTPGEKVSTCEKADSLSLLKGSPGTNIPQDCGCSENSVCENWRDHEDTYKKKVEIEGKHIEVLLRLPKKIMKHFAEEVELNNALKKGNEKILEYLIDSNLKIIIERAREVL